MRMFKNFNKTKVDTILDNLAVHIVHPIYKDFKINTLLFDLGEKSNVLSTLTGYRKVSYVANTYVPPKLSCFTMKNYQSFTLEFPQILDIDPQDITFLSTSVDMKNLAICEKSYKELKICCFATAGAKGNALRTGVDLASYSECDGKFIKTSGTINLIIVTNAVLSPGAMARTIITATEAKTAALQDLDVRSTSSPQFQATGTGTDNIIVVSGKMGKPLLLTNGHIKIGELIGHSVKKSVEAALKKHDNLF